jgi:iron(III) transport system substrate-binding protein
MTQIEESARREGKLVIYAAPGHANAEAQAALARIFRERYGVVIEWTSLSARDIGPRIMAEQRTQQYAADVAMSGIAGNYTELKPRGYLAPILAPSTLEKGVWRLDPWAASPKDRDWLFINLYLSPSFLINTRLVPSGEEPRSYKDLLKPKWKGKIVYQIPWAGGTGSGWFRATYRALGVDHMTALAEQVVLVPQVNDPPDAVVRGQYPIALSPSLERGRQLIEEGAPVKFVEPEEGLRLGTNGVELIANAPHPNAAKLFLHWFYTREGQTVYARNNRAVSVRKDVPQDYLPPDQRYVEGQKFMVADADDFTAEGSQRVTNLARKIFEKAKP